MAEQKYRTFGPIFVRARAKPEREHLLHADGCFGGVVGGVKVG